jgi:ribosomal protein L40E
MMPPEVCPHCGAEVPSGAKACAECGSDELTGWSAEARDDHLNLPGASFDYDDFVAREIVGERTIPRGVHWFWWMVAILMVSGLIGLWLL